MRKNRKKRRNDQINIDVVKIMEYLEIDPVKVNQILSELEPENTTGNQDSPPVQESIKL